MQSSDDRGPMLAYAHPLPGGSRVRLRLARGRDGEGIAALLVNMGYRAEGLDIARLVRFDPRARCVISATCLIDGRECIVGVGAIALGEREPELLVADETRAQGLRELLWWALLSRTHSTSGTLAA